MDPSMQKVMGDTQKNMKGLEKGMEGAQKKSGLLRRSFGNLSGAAKLAGGLIVTYLGARTFKAVIGAASEFEDQMANISTLLTGDVSASMQQMNEDVKRIAKQTGVSTELLADGLYQVVSAFGEAKDNAEVLEIATKAASAGNAEVADSVNLLSAVTKGYGDTSAEAVQKASDLAFATVRLGQTSFPELASSMGKVIPLAATLGAEQEELFGAMATLTGVTGNTAEVTTQLRATLQGFLQPSNAMGDALKSLGYENGQVALQSEGLQGILESLRKEVDNDEIAFANLFGSVEAKNAVLALTGSQAENFTEKTKEMANAVGATEEAFEKKQKTAKAAWARIQQYINVAAINIGDKFLPIIAEGLTWTMDLFDKVWPKVSEFANQFAEPLKGLGKVVQGIFQYMSGNSYDGFISFVESGFSPGIIKMVDNFAKSVGEIAANVKDAISIGKGFIQNLFGDRKDGNASIISANLGPDTTKKLLDIAKNVREFGETVVTYFKSAFNTLWPILQMVFQNVQDGIAFLMPYIVSAIGPVVGFFKGILEQISTFWQENGAQIIQALVNIGGFLKDTFIFLLPFILGIVKAVWGNIQGVISGAVGVITGIIKLLASVFTGDMAGMWEALKQIFMSGVKLIWNMIQLTFYGRIIGGIRALAIGARTILSGMWTAIRTFFTNGVVNAVTSVGRFVVGVRNGFTRARTAVVDTMRRMYDAVKSRFDSMVTGARELPGRLGSGIRAMASKAVDGVKKLGNDMVNGLAAAINGVGEGVNWILGKIGVSFTIPSWVPPAYAKGTDYHPGGPAIVGDGGGPELMVMPNGRQMLSPSTDTLMNLPKGTQVLPYEKTTQLMKGIPAYAEGTGLINRAWDGVRNFAGRVKDVTTDVFSYISNPSKLLTNVLNDLGVALPSLNGAAGKLVPGAFSFIKNKAVEFLTSKIGDFGADGGSGGVGANTFANWRLTSPFGMRVHPITGRRTMHRGVDYAAPTGTPLRSNVSGRVSGASYLGGYGNTVQVQSGMFTHLYAHLSRILTNVGRQVKAGDLLGLIGSTGRSTGPHLHYEVRRGGMAINPMPFVGRGFAKGGTVSHGQTAWVGEQGPELAQLPGGTRILNNKDSMGVGGYTIEINDNRTIRVEGNADVSLLKRLLDEDRSELVRLIEKIIREKDRLAFR